MVPAGRAWTHLSARKRAGLLLRFRFGSDASQELSNNAANDKPIMNQ